MLVHKPITKISSGMKKLLLIALLAPLFIGAAPPDSNQNTVEFWGGTGQYRRDSGCGRYQKVEYQDLAVRYKYKVVEEEEYLNDSGKVAVKKVVSPFTFILDASYTRGTATDLDRNLYDTYHSTPAGTAEEYFQTGFKLQGDWRKFGLGLGVVLVDDDTDAGILPSVFLRAGQNDQFYLTGEMCYANPFRSGHGVLAAGLGMQTSSLELWGGAGAWAYEDRFRPCLAVKYHFGDMLLGVAASYATFSQDGVVPYSVSVGVGYEF